MRQTQLDADGDEICEYCGDGMILGSRAWLHKKTGKARCENPAPVAPLSPPKMGPHFQSIWEYFPSFYV